MTEGIKKRVVVLEVHAKAAVPVLESCKAMDLCVVAGSWKRHGCGQYSRAVDSKVYYPRPDAEPDKCIQFLLNYLQNNTVGMVFPVGDVMIDLVAKHQDQLREVTNMILPSYDIFVKGRNKIQTLKTAAKADCPIPLTWYPEDEFRCRIRMGVRSVGVTPHALKNILGSMQIFLCFPDDKPQNPQVVAVVLAVNCFCN